jgi:hypothetical protein
MSSHRSCMNVNLMQNMYQKNDPKMPNWSKIEALIPPIHLRPDILEFSQTHESINGKIAMADYHYHILDQLYRPSQTDMQTDTKWWARAEMHCIITNLYSALDSLTHEINLAYNMGLQPKHVDVHHDHAIPNPKSKCVRCRLPQGDPVGSYLNQELSQPWFATFKNLRHQITHRNVPIIQSTITVGDPTIHMMIPDDPTKNNPQNDPPPGDFSKKLEINQYCFDRRNNVLNSIEKIYPILEPMIRQRYRI